MAESTAVYDGNVFDLGVFDSRDITPYLFKVAIEPAFRKVVPGQSLVILVYIKNTETTIGRMFNYNPGEIPEIEIYKPDGTVKQAYTDMYNTAVGVFAYAHTVGLSDPVGVYTGRFKALNGTKTMLTPKMVLFEVLSIA